MKRITLALIAMLIALTVSAQTNYVLITGVSNYGTGNPDHNLVSTTKDAKDLSKLFRQMPNTKVTVLTSKYATAENVTKKLKAILTVAKKDDKIFFFFSGHGAKDNMVYYQGGMYNYGDFVKVLSKAKTSNIYCFIDCCNSGNAKGYIEDPAYSSNHDMTFFLASRDVENSREDPILLRNGFLTQALLKGLRGMSDTNKDKAVTVSELYTYVYNDVLKKNEEQHTQLVCPKNAVNSVLVKW